MNEHTAKIILETVADERGYAWRAESIIADTGKDEVKAEVFNPAGPECWSATMPTLYGAACAVATMMGWDLEDG